MSRKDCVALADMLRLLRPISEPTTLARFRDALAAYLSSHAGFDRERWLGYIDDPSIEYANTNDVPVGPTLPSVVVERFFRKDLEDRIRSAAGVSK